MRDQGVHVVILNVYFQLPRMSRDDRLVALTFLRDSLESKLGVDKFIVDTDPEEWLVRSEAWNVHESNLQQDYLGPTLFFFFLLCVLVLLQSRINHCAYGEK